ncbi:ATP-binding protein [Acidaminobacter sp. JC074]|uniref:ATP-binding protein n=1 Tax=Acidaminobacter sp. JC074 TaxID=2530199 RepID=UPI001F0D7971|nr:ATP-binding protein [Acidaminobacter sp. JC074]MCH4890632.1 ATP-binding protein [Acidaminobacter sp. JC074]
MFVGRSRELDFFEDKFHRKEGQLIVLYGRRRIGKTELLRVFSKDKFHLFYSSTETADSNQLGKFSNRLIKLYKESEYLNTFSTWEEAIKYFSNIPASTKKVLVIDEFPYMVKANQEIPSILQNLWDEDLRHKNLMIVLCGSSMSFIENEILAEKNPLYGRAAGIYKLDALPFKEVVKLLNNFSLEEQIIIYGITGGVPHYIRQFDNNITLEENIKKNILTKGNVLYNEVEFLMRQELRETSIYNTLISVIALGNTKLNEIYQKTGIDKAKIGVYLKNLIELGIIEREFPITEKTKAKANVQRGLYRITDNYFRFWFKFIFPNYSDLEEGNLEEVYDNLIESLNTEYTSFVFEEICIEYLKTKQVKETLPIKLKKIGRYWDKTIEIDVLAFNDKDQCIIGECKWRNKKVGENVFYKLEEKSEKLNMQVVGFVLFSKAGFTQSLKKLEKEREDLMLVELSDFNENLLRDL